VLLLNEPLNSSMIAEAAQAGVAGIIAPSISAADLVSYLGEEPGVILTGGEDLPFSIVILRGIGRVGLEGSVYDSLLRYEGENCVLFTTTRLRAGVERPFVLLQQGE
jgi:hypothetical protein